MSDDPLKLGRPLRAEAVAETLQIRLSPAERQHVEAAAAVNHQTLSDFGRDALVTAAAECLDESKPD